MAIYVNNGPIVFPVGGGEKSIYIEIDGNAVIDGKKVVEWTNVSTNASWLTIEFIEEQYDNGYYYEFNLIADIILRQGGDRSAVCYFSYILEDGTEKTESVTVYQNGKSGVSLDCENPLFLGNDSVDNPYTVTVKYAGITDRHNINNISNSDTYFSVTPIVGWADEENGDYYIEYEIEPRQRNYDAIDKYGSVTFSYLNAHSVSSKRTLRLTLNACMRPFGLTQSNGHPVPEETYMGKTYKRLRNIPFNANSIILHCCYPYSDGFPTYELDNRNEGTATISVIGGGYLGEEYGRDSVEEAYSINFTENKTEYSRRVDLTVRYTTLDGYEMSETVQLFQNASDGSNLEPQIITRVNQIKYKADGTPEMASNASVDIQWIGNFDYKDFYTNVDWVMLGDGELVEDYGDYNKTYRHQLTVLPNKFGEARSTELTFSGEANGTYYETKINLIQARDNKEEIIVPEIPVEGDDYCGPIWKDVEYNFGGSSEVNYSIYVVEHMSLGNLYWDEDVLIFSGKSCKKPSETSNKILVNKICQNYLDAPRLIQNAVAVGGGYNVFKLKDEGGQTTYRTFRFVNDWSYTDDFKTGLVSHPILNDRMVAKNQLLPFTIFGAAEKVVVPMGIIYRDGLTNDYGEPIEDWESSTSMKNGLLTEMFPYSRGGEDVVKYYIGDTEWDVCDCCKTDYVLYYVNPWGGYDWFPIRGKVTEKDSLTQYHYTQNYNNTTWEFGKRRYLSEINKKYQLNTHWLKEDESKRMWYLLESNTVYLHNLKENKIYPVLITNTEVEYKQRGIKSNRISYQIEVELSQTRERL